MEKEQEENTQEQGDQGRNTMVDSFLGVCQILNIWYEKVFSSYKMRGAVNESILWDEVSK